LPTSIRHAVTVRIAYLISWRGGTLTGPFKKMAAQAATWTRLGHDVGLFVATSREAAEDWQALPEAVQVEVASSGALSGLAARRATYRALQRWRPEVVYLRHGVYAPGLRRVVRHVPTVLEINGDEVTIARQTSRLKGAWTAATRSRVLSQAAGAVFMTRELANSPGLARYRFERIVVPNGVDLAATPRLAATTGPAPRLVLLGHPRSPWHGTDKLVGLAHRHPEWAFDVIGPDAGDLGQPAPSNLTLHPELPTERYLPLLAQADVGIGSLAMHRIGANENPALKVREYLALGLATMIGCHDPDFPDPVEHVLELPNTESNVADHDEGIERFVSAWQGRRVGRDQITNLDITVKEQRRLAFISRCAAPLGSGDPAEPA
jgi:Glycosyltransferase Family 4